MSHVVTDHAIDRFIERFPRACLDRAAARQAVVDLTSTGVRLGASGVFVSGCTFVLSGVVVVTVLPGRHRHLERQHAVCRHRVAREVRA